MSELLLTADQFAIAVVLLAATQSIATHPRSAVIDNSSSAFPPMFPADSASISPDHPVFSDRVLAVAAALFSTASAGAEVGRRMET